jgi:hypothetical protein
MPETDDKGRSITGIKSALPEKDKLLYGNKTRGGDNIFNDVEPDELAQAAQPDSITQPTKTTQLIHNEPEPSKPELEEDEAKALSDEGKGSPTEKTETPEAEMIKPKAVGEIEVEQSEYDHLKSQPLDDLIAWGLDHRKGKSTLQSRLDKLQNVIGKQLIDAVEAGENLTGVQKLLADLPDASFQQHLAKFYETHELKNGSYIRTKAELPAPDLLKRYAETIVNQASLNVTNFYDGDADDFDYNEAVRNPSSKAGVALSKYENEKRKLEAELQKIESESNQSQQSVQPQSDDQVRRQNQRAWDGLINRYKELNIPDKLRDFRAFADQHRTPETLLEAIYKAFQFDLSAKRATRTLIVRELEAIGANKSVSTPPEKADKSKAKIKAPANIKAEELNKIKADHDYFGDILQPDEVAQ